MRMVVGWKIPVGLAAVLFAGLLPLMRPLSAAAAVVEVDMQRIAFHPSHIRVHPGDRILFKNLDPFEHSLDMVDAADPNHEILPETVVKGGDSFTAPFRAKGVFILYCNNHGGMKAIVSTTGSFELPKLALGRAQPREVKLGERLFWGKAHCWYCHKIGKRGRGTRGPNLQDIGFRARRLARKLKLDTGTDYLEQSLAHPEAYIVAGRINDMPKTYLPPLNLSPQELTDIIVYLQSQGGQPDPFEVTLPSEVRNPVMPWQAYFKGDAKAGRRLFWSRNSPVACAKCHSVNGRGGRVGPDLTGIGAVYPPKFFVRAILYPSAEIATGFETTMVATTGRRLITGIIVSESKDKLVIRDARNGVLESIPKNSIRRRKVQRLSMMPGNYAELMSVKQLSDIVAYLQTLKGEKKKTRRGK